MEVITKQAVTVKIISIIYFIPLYLSERGGFLHPEEIRWAPQGGEFDLDMRSNPHPHVTAPNPNGESETARGFLFDAFAPPRIAILYGKWFAGFWNRYLSPSSWVLAFFVLGWFGPRFLSKMAWPFSINSLAFAMSFLPIQAAPILQ